MLGAVYLAQHRFLEAREAGTAQVGPTTPGTTVSSATRPSSSAAMPRPLPPSTGWRRSSLRPRCTRAWSTPGSCRGSGTARWCAMHMAAEGTSAHDLEGQAWAFAQLGSLYLHRGALDDASREFSRSRRSCSRTIRTRCTVWRASPWRPWELRPTRCGASRELYARAQTPELAAEIGDLERLAGHDDRSRVRPVGRGRSLGACRVGE